MPSVISCPKCERKLRVPDDLLGTDVKCPTCGETFTAPTTNGTAPPPDEPPPARASRRTGRMPDEERPSRRREDDDFPEDRPSRRRREDDEDRPSRRRDDDFAEDRPSRRGIRRRSAERPGKVQAIGIMTLIGGIFALLVAVGWASTCIGLLWPGMYYSIVVGVMGLIKGIQLLGDDAHLQPPPKAISIMMIINIINGDIVNCVMGILNLVFLSEDEVSDYFRG
ncbi:MAG TPA: MJ0042-type zinc finger domain-containing protein [Gemmataceae bacterium]|nr:MJ0042-type zinc finger domain-containing protein [Gemmataceae bacterium]